MRGFLEFSSLVDEVSVSHSKGNECRRSSREERAKMVSRRTATGTPHSLIDISCTANVALGNWHDQQETSRKGVSESDQGNPGHKVGELRKRT